MLNFSPSSASFGSAQITVHQKDGKSNKINIPHNGEVYITNIVDAGGEQRLCVDDYKDGMTVLDYGIPTTETDSLEFTSIDEGTKVTIDVPSQQKGYPKIIVDALTFATLNLEGDTVVDTLKNVIKSRVSLEGNSSAKVTGVTAWADFTLNDAATLAVRHLNAHSAVGNYVTRNNPDDFNLTVDKVTNSSVFQQGTSRANIGVMEGKRLLGFIGETVAELRNYGNSFAKVGRVKNHALVKSIDNSAVEVDCVKKGGTVSIEPGVSRAIDPELRPFSTVNIVEKEANVDIFGKQHVKIEDDQR